MHQPIIGLTCFSFRGPTMSPGLPPSLRSGVNQDYIDAVTLAGGAPVCIPMGLDESALRRVYSTLDGLLLPGGDDIAPRRYGQEPHPDLGAVDEDRDELELTMASWALHDGLPILGICRGIQVLAVAAGGTLYQHVPADVGTATSHDVRGHGRDHLCHDIEIAPGSRLAEALQCTRVDVNSFHHQAVKDVPPNFFISARACDDVIEGIESAGSQFAVGVQCHPEGMWRTSAPKFAGVFRAFVDAAQERARRAA